jgi:hypothetical protein
MIAALLITVEKAQPPPGCAFLVLFKYLFYFTILAK